VFFVIASQFFESGPLFVKNNLVTNLSHFEIPLARLLQVLVGLFENLLGNTLVFGQNNLFLLMWLLDSDDQKHADDYSETTSNHPGHSPSSPTDEDWSHVFDGFA
jgi:hypothetical protein